MFGFFLLLLFQWTLRSVADFFDNLKFGRHMLYGDYSHCFPQMNNVRLHLIGTALVT